MGGKLFNARANASNFDLDELEKIVQYAHLRDVKIHITLNTLLGDNELIEAVKFARELYIIGVDAVIVQDLGLAYAIHKNIPNLAIHASTQISTHNLEQVLELAKLGFSRVVLARELPINEISYILKNSPIEIEIFAHGALCVSYSGECLFSSMIGDRSGNRGKCAQPCRLPYKLICDNKELGNGYLLSPKDLCTIDILNKLPNVHCLKIEGRMKSPEYVATVVKTYRKYIDNLETKVSNDDKNNLIQIFNRGGFTTGYLENKLGKDMMCFEKPKNWGVYIGKVTSYDGKRYITLDNVKDLEIGDGIEVWTKDKNNSPSTIISELTKNKIGRINGNINVGDKVYRTSSKSLNTSAKSTYTRGFVKKSKINVEFIFKKNIPISLKINNYLFNSNIVPEIAERSSISKDSLEKQLLKTGNTPFEISNLSIDFEDGLFLPISIINNIRRNALDEYEKYFISTIKKECAMKPTNLQSIFDIKDSNITNRKSKEISLFINFFDKKLLSLKNVDNFYFSYKDAITNLDLITKFNGKKYVLFPLISKSNYANLIKNNIKNLASKVDGFVLSNLGQLEYLKQIENTTIEEIKSKYNLTLVANYTFNIFNSYTLNLLKLLGFDKITLSPELTKDQINSIESFSNIKTEVISYGNICVMNLEYCPIGSIIGGFDSNHKCSKPCLTNKKFVLRDRMNIDFRVVPDNIDCQSRIFNSKINSIETKNLNVDSLRVDILDENFSEVQNIINEVKLGNKLSGENYTNGHFNRPV